MDETVYLSSLSLSLSLCFRQRWRNCAQVWHNLLLCDQFEWMNGTTYTAEVRVGLGIAVPALHFATSPHFGAYGNGMVGHTSLPLRLEQLLVRFGTPLPMRIRSCLCFLPRWEFYTSRGSTFFGGPPNERNRTLILKGFWEDLG